MKSAILIHTFFLQSPTIYDALLLLAELKELFDRSVFLTQRFLVKGNQRLFGITRSSQAFQWLVSKLRNRRKTSYGRLKLISYYLFLICISHIFKIHHFEYNMAANIKCFN